MQIEQTHFTAEHGWSPSPPGTLSEAGLVLVFGGTSIIEHSEGFAKIREAYPSAFIFGCSTAGEIEGTHVTDDALVVTAVEFAATTLRYAGRRVMDLGDSFKTGEALANALPHEGLVHVFVLSDG
jgi:hypothetical protein